MNKAIKVTACIITYNQDKYIKECIEGALAQQVEHYEIIIGDDCSTDNTSKICQEYQDKYPSLIRHVKREENLGMIGNWIETITNAKGKYIAMCEGDDYWTDPLKLQKQVDFLEANPDYVITYSGVEAFDGNGVLENMVGGAKRDLTPLELQHCTPINTLTACFRNVISTFPTEMTISRFADLFLWSLLGAHGKGKYLSKIKPSRYRVHQGGVFSKQSKLKKQEMWLLTTGALYAYYSRIGNETMKKYFHQKNLVASLTIYGVFPFFKYILAKYIKLFKFK